MKILTPEEEKGHHEANIRGIWYGTAAAGAICIPAHFALKRYSRVYKHVPIPLRAFAYSSIFALTVSIGAEKAGEYYDMAQWKGAGAESLEAKAQARDKEWDEMTVLQKAGDFTNRWKFPLISASWAGVLAGSYAMVSRDKSMTIPQRLVQARIYAQAWTVVCLIAAVAASQTGNERGETKRKGSDEHSWQDIVAHSQAAARLKQEQGQSK